jgi:hypothetical protein
MTIVSTKVIEKAVSLQFCADWGKSEISPKTAIQIEKIGDRFFSAAFGVEPHAHQAKKKSTPTFHFKCSLNAWTFGVHKVLFFTCFF